MVIIIMPAFSLHELKLNKPLESVKPLKLSQGEAIAEEYYAFSFEPVLLFKPGLAADCKRKLALAVHHPVPGQARVMGQVFQGGAYVAGMVGISGQAGNLPIGGDTA